MKKRKSMKRIVTFALIAAMLLPDASVFAKETEAADVTKAVSAVTEVTDADTVNTDKSDTDKSEADKPDADKPDADKSGTDKSNTDKSDTDKPDADKAGTDKSEADKAAQEAAAALEGLYLGEEKLEEGDTVSEEDLLVWKQIIVFAEERTEITVPHNLLIAEDKIDSAVLTDVSNPSAVSVPAVITKENGSYYLEKPEEPEAPTISGNIAGLPEGIRLLSVPCTIDPAGITEDASGTETIEAIKAIKTVKTIKINGLLLLVKSLTEPLTGPGGELPVYLMEVFKQTTPPDDDDEPLKNGDTIQLNDTLYVQIEKANLTDITAGLDYTITIPVAIGAPNASGSTAIYVDLTSPSGMPISQKFATLSWTNGVSALTVQFLDFEVETNQGKVTLAMLQNIKMAFECKLKDDASAADDQGKIDIVLPGNKTITITVEDWIPKGPELKKTPGTFNVGGTTDWTVKYAHPTATYHGQFPTQLKDQLPEGMEFVTDADKVILYINGTKVTATPGALPAGITIDSDSGLLTFDLAVGNVQKGDKVELTYQTKLTEKELNTIWGMTTNKNYKNTVQGIDTDDSNKVLCSIDSSVTVPNDWIGKKMINKSATVVRPAAGGTDPWKINWKVDVSTVSTNFVHLHMIDTMGKGLILDESSVKITDNTGRDVTADIEKSVATVTGNKTQLTVKLVKEPGGTAKSSYTITYTTAIDNSYFDQTDGSNLITDSDIKNRATLSFSWPTGTTPGTPPVPPSIVIGPGNIGVNNDLIQKSASSSDYNAAERSITWTIIVNPNKVNLTAANIEDDLSDTTKGHCFVVDGINDQSSAEAAVSTAVADAISGISGASIVSLSIVGNKLSMQLKDIGKNSFSFKVKTYSTNPDHWAANGTAYYTNIVNMVKTGTTVDNTQIRQDDSAAVQINPTINVIKKENLSYSPETNKIEWRLTVNKNGAVLGDVDITDVLAEGLSCDAADALLDSGAFGGDNTFTVTEDPATHQSTVNIHLSNVSAKKMIVFQTLVDVNSETFRNNKEVTFENTVKMKSASNGNEQTSESKAVIVNNVLDKEGKTPTQTGTNRADYTVTLNPNHMDLLAGKPEGTKLYLTDKLQTGLYLDIDTVKIFEASSTRCQHWSDQYIPLIDKGAEINPRPEFTYDPADNSFSLLIPDAAKTYVVTYSAFVVRAGVELKNNVKLEGSVIPDGEETNDAEMSFSMRASGSAGFSLPADKFISIRIKKVDQAGNKLSGAGFGLYASKTDSVPLVQGTCDASSGFCVLGLPISTMTGMQKLYWKEITPPVGYALNDEWHEITKEELTAASNIIETSLVNVSDTDKTSGKISILKTDGANALSGARFELYADKDCTVKIKEETEAGSDGTLVFDNLYPTRTYWVKETVAPAGYLLSAEPVAITAEKVPVQKEIENEKFNVTLDITKLDAEDNGITLQGTQFGLFEKYEGGSCTEQVGTTQTTDVNGVCSFLALKPNSTYYLKEMAPAAGYKSNSGVYTITTEENNKTVNFRIANYKVGWDEKASIKITKTDKDGSRKLAGAVFRLYKSDKKTIMSGDQTTDANGVCTFNSLAKGTYYIREIKAPDGYEIIEEWYEKEVGMNTAETISITNNEVGWNKKASIEITKTDKDGGKKLAGAVFQLYGSDKSTIYGKETTDSEGICTFKNLLKGTYYIREIQAPDGYEIIEEWYEKEVGMNTAETIAITNNVVGWNTKASIRLTKTDLSGNSRLPGAVFELYEQDKTTLIEEKTTDKDGILSFDKLKEGTYYLKETKAPKGYILNKQWIEVTVEMNRLEEIAVTNEKIPKVNPPEEHHSQDDPDPAAVNPQKPVIEESAQNSIPKTDVKDHISLWAAGLVVSLLAAAGLGFLLFRQKSMETGTEMRAGKSRKGKTLRRRKR